MASFHLEAQSLLGPFAGSGRDLWSSGGLWGACNWGGKLEKAVNGGRCVSGWPLHTHFLSPLPQITASVGITNKGKDKVMSVYVGFIIINAGSVNSFQLKGFNY